MFVKNRALRISGGNCVARELQATSYNGDDFD